MGHNPRSINEGCKSLDVEASQIDRDRSQEEYDKHYRQAKMMAAFLRNLTSQKQESTSNQRVCPFSSTTNHQALAVSMINHQDQGYAFYRKKYLVMHNPFKTFRNDGAKKSMKDKIIKWFVMSLKKQHNKNAKSIEPNPKSPSDSEDKPLSPTFFESVLLSLRCIAEQEGDVDEVAVPPSS